MNPHSKPRPLIFTPRSPWGRLPLKRTAQNHMRASEDKKPDPTAKDMQGLGGQMASGSQPAGFKPTAAVPASSMAAGLAPNNPRWPAGDNEIVRPKVPTPPAAPGSGVLLRPQTEQEKMNEQIKRSGGAQNSIQMPEHESLLEKLPVKPSFDIKHRHLEGVELEKEVPWDQVFRK